MNTINMYCYMCNKSHTSEMLCSAYTEKSIISRLRLDVNNALRLREIALCNAYQKMQEDGCGSSGHEMINKETKAIGERLRSINMERICYINGVISDEAEYNLIVNHRISILINEQYRISREDNLCAEIIRVEKICGGLFAELMTILTQIQTHTVSHQKNSIAEAILCYDNISDEIHSAHLFLNELDKCRLYDEASSNINDIRCIAKEAALRRKHDLRINFKSMFII